MAFTDDEEYKNFIGISIHIAKIESLLRIGRSPDVHVVGICGPGGIGKTIIAEIVFNRLADQFDVPCFVEPFGKYRKRMLVGESTVDPSGLSRFYDSQLRNSKALIVLDGVEDSEQLEELQQQRLLPGYENWFGDGSRIIITTRDKRVLENWIDDDHVYNVEGLTYHQALEIFQMHSFKKISPTVHRLTMSEVAVHYCKGNPLAVTVLGSVFGCSSDEKWTAMLEKLQELPDNDGDAKSVLNIIYQELDEEEKLLLQLVALYSQHYDRKYVEGVLCAHDVKASFAMDDLIDKSLVKVVNNKMSTHNLLQEMGVEIAEEEQLLSSSSSLMRYSWKRLKSLGIRFGFELANLLDLV